MEMNNGNRPPHNRMLPPQHISNGNGHEQWTKLTAPHSNFDEHQVNDSQFYEQLQQQSNKTNVIIFSCSSRWVRALVAKIRVRWTVRAVRRQSTKYRPNRLATWKRRTEPWPRTKVKRCWLARMAVARLMYQLCRDQTNRKCLVARKRAPPICKWKFRRTRKTAVSHWPDQQPLNSVSRFVNAFPMGRTVCRNRVPI